MGGVTAHGWPYVTPSDHPKEYPAASQALANKLETDSNAPLTGYSERGADGTQATPGQAVGATVNLTGATGRLCLVTAEVVYTTTAVSTLYFILKNGATQIRSYALAGHAATAGGADRCQSISAVVLATGVTFTVETNHSAGSLTIRARTGLTVTAL